MRNTNNHAVSLQKRFLIEYKEIKNYTLNNR